MSAASLMALVPLTFAAPAQATTDQLDQALTLNSWLGFQSGVAYMAQTFTAGISGQVDRVSIPVNTVGWGMFSVSLTSVAANGQPTSTVLGSSPTASGWFSCCGFHDFGFSPTVPVTSGTQYAIVVHTLGGTVHWLDAGTADIYTAGRQYIGGSPTSWFTTAHFDFGFEEWVIGGRANQAPVVTAATTAVSVPEGTAATNSGACSDPDGDAVALKASSGTVSSCSGGAWTWSQPVSDEGPTQTVTVTADDGQGFTITTSFTVNVFAVAPTATILTDPASVPEGTPVPFTGGATSPDAADNSAGFTYSWTVLKNGSPYTTGSGAAFTFTPDDDGTYLVTLVAADDGGMSSLPVSATVIATNVSPVATVESITSSLPLVTTPGESLVFSGGVTDVDSSRDSFTTTWDFGDGASASGSTATHAYTTPGTYTVTFEVSDGEGGFGMAQQTVTVQTTEQAIATIAAYVDGLPGLTTGQKNSLTAKLSAASAAAARGNDVAASNQLDAFLNELQADVNTGRVSPTDAGIVQAAISAVEDDLGSNNHF